MVGLLRSMLASNPVERPQSARELLAALRRCREAIEAVPRRRKRLTLVVLAFGLLAIIVVGLTNYFLPWQQPAVPEKSIAVLPFLDLSQAKDQEYFCDGMSEEILRCPGEGRGATRRCPHLVIFLQREERERERRWEKAKRRECA